MKKGFTMIEVLAVVVVIGIIALIITPATLGVIGRAKTNMYNQQIKEFKETAIMYAFDNVDDPYFANVDETLPFRLSIFNEEGYISLPITNAKTGEAYDAYDVYIMITKQANNSYDIEVFDDTVPTLNGVKIIKKFTGDIYINHSGPSTVNNGEIYMNTGTISFSDANDVNYPSGQMIVSQLENAGIEEDNAYLMYIGSDSARFTSSYSHDYFLITRYDSGTWYYSNNASWVSFTTNSSDYLLGKITKDSADLGISNFYQYY